MCSERKDTESTSVTGFYVAYFTAEIGSSLGVFCVADGKVTGADLGGGLYDGEYTIVGGTAKGNMTFRSRRGGVMITGKTSDLPVSYESLFAFKLPIEDQPYHELSTIGGPVNVRFEKVRDLT